MLLTFIYLALSSLVLGVFFGLLASYILKKINMNENPIRECMVILTSGYLAYLMAESVKFSGIMTIFSCGFTMAHYAYYNVSSEAQKGSIIAVEVVSQLAESFLYIYLGICAYSINTEIIIPGYAAAIAGDVEEELSGWKITVGPREAAHIAGFLKNR